MSLRRLQGWEPKRTTTYRHVRGRLVEAVETVDPEWNAEQRAYAAALELYEARLCGGCGMPRDQVWGEHNAGRVVAGHDWCHGCIETHRHSEAAQEQGRPAQALRVHARLRDD